MSERIICNDNGGELREEIVRCRDCAFYAPTPDPIDPGWPMWRCELHEIDLVCPDRFCAWGDRRNNGEAQ